MIKRNDYYSEIEWNDIYEDYDILKSFSQEGFYDKVYPKSINSSRKMYKKIIKKLMNFVEDIKFQRKHENTIFMSNIDRFEYLAHTISEQFNIVTISKVNAPKMEFDYYKYHPIDFDEKLYLGFKERRIENAIEVIDKISALFVKKKIKVVLLSCDRSFIERALVFAAKKNSIPVVVFQHGIFIGDDIPRTKIGIYGDQYWVWCNYIKEKFLDAFGNKKRDVRLMGYPFEIKNKNNKNKKRVLFIGEDYSNLNSDYDALFNQSARYVCRACSELGLDFYFRPHPNINRDSIIDNFSNEKNFRFSEQKNLMDDMNDSLVIIGDFSSVLLEAALIKKPVIQIDWGEYVHNLLKQKMYSFSTKVTNSYEPIKKALEMAAEGKIKTEIDDYYLHLNDNLGNDVCAWIRELIKG